MRNMLNTMKDRLVAGEDLVLVTVIASSGATPRGAGARMLIGKQGRICGTIGGGAVEYRSEAIAKTVLENKSSYGHDFTLTKDDVQNLGMICGGTCNVFFHYIPAGDFGLIALAEEAERRFAKGEELWLISDIAAGGQLSLAKKSEEALAKHLTRHPHRVQEDGKDLYIEQINTSGRVSDYCTIGSEDYVCVMTRGHAYDTLVQAQVLRCCPAYCGVIGSVFKAAGVRKTLKEEYGLLDEELALVTTPIGLNIKAETPAEIAVSIAAQMILYRAERNGL